MENFKKKNERGITLVALVVTIIVLIILALISINAVFGEDGIIKRAEQAREEHRAGSVKDQIAMWKADQVLADYIGDSATESKEDFLAGLVEEGLLTEEEKTGLLENGETTIGSQKVEFTVETGAARLVDMFNAAKTAGCEGGDACADPENHLHIGDYVNYENPTSGEVTIAGTVSGMQDYVYNTEEMLTNQELNQTYKVANNQVNWRVLGIDKETGGIKLIAATPLKKESTSGDRYLYMYGAKSYLNSVTVGENIGILDQISSMYANSKYGKVTARSVTIDDVNEIAGITSEDEIKRVNMDAYDGGKQYGETYTFENQWTPADWEENSETAPASISGTVDGYWYTINGTYNDGAEYAEVTNTRAYYLLFNDIDWETGGCYWLASRGVEADSSYAFFGPGYVYSLGGLTRVFNYGQMFSSRAGGESELWSAVRPVVCLESGVTVEQLQKIDDIAETLWAEDGSTSILQ